MTNYEEARELLQLLPSMSTSGQFFALFSDYLSDHLSLKDIKALGEGRILHIPIQDKVIVDKLNRCSKKARDAILEDLPEMFEIYGWKAELTINTLTTKQPFVRATPYVLSLAFLDDPDDPPESDDDPTGDEEELEDKAPVMAMAARA